MEVDTNDKWPIDKLPEEVLVEIFSFLDSKDLHELAKVRTDWQQFINDNARTRKKLVLDLNRCNAFRAIDSLLAGSEVEWQINKLPELVLVKIFSFLSSNDLHELAKVCHSWKVLILENSETKSVLNMNCISVSSKINSSQNVDLAFRYNTFDVFGCKIWNEASETLKRFSNDLRRLCLESCEFDNGNFKEQSSFTRLLKTLGNLEVIEMRGVGRESTFANVEPLKLEKLKSVILDESSLGVLKVIGLSQLEILKIVESGPTTASEMRELVEFLCTQTNLKKLELFDVDYWNVIEAKDIERMNFPLELLSLHHQRNFMGGESIALAFLEKFSNTLEKLSLGCSFESSFYALIFEKLRKSQSLKLGAQYLPKDVEFYKTLHTLSSVKELIIWGCCGDELLKYAQGVIGHLPNIETLVIKGFHPKSNDLMAFISNNLLELRNLAIGALAEITLRGVTKFENLRKLNVGTLYEVTDQDWSEMLIAMPNVEQFTIWRCFYRLDSAKFDAMTKSWPQLRVLNLGIEFVPEAQMFNNLLARCPNITTVRVSGCEANHSAFKDFKKPGLRLIARRDMNFEKLENEKNPNLLNYY